MIARRSSRGASVWSPTPSRLACCPGNLQHKTAARVWHPCGDPNPTRPGAWRWGLQPALPAAEYLASSTAENAADQLLSPALCRSVPGLRVSRIRRGRPGQDRHTVGFGSDHLNHKTGGRYRLKRNSAHDSAPKSCPPHLPPPASRVGQSPFKRRLTAKRVDHPGWASRESRLAVYVLTLATDPLTRITIPTSFVDWKFVALRN